MSYFLPTLFATCIFITVVNIAQAEQLDESIYLDKSEQIFRGGSEFILKIDKDLPLFGSDTKICFITSIGQWQKNDNDYYNSETYLTEINKLNVIGELITFLDKKHTFENGIVTGQKLSEKHTKQTQYEHFICANFKEPLRENTAKKIKVKYIKFTFKKDFTSKGIFWDTSNHEEYSKQDKMKCLITTIESGVKTSKECPEIMDRYNPEFEKWKFEQEKRLHDIKNAEKKYGL